MTQAELDQLAPTLNSEAREAAHSDPRVSEETTPDEFMAIYSEHLQRLEAAGTI